MSFRNCAAASAASLLALSAAHAAEPLKTSALSLETGGPMPAEQAALAFDHADLKFKILPDQKAIEGEATLTFTAKAPLTKLVVDFDRVFAISKLTIDGKALKPSAWTNPEGKMTITLPRTVAKGKSVTLAVTYAGAPLEAKRAPWDGGFVWSKTESGEPWIATAVQGDGCDIFWPCIDYPTGEPKLVDLHITVPAPLVAPANGVFKGMTEKDGWRTYNWQAKTPNTYAIALDVGPYEEISGTYKSRFGDTIPMTYWHLKGDTEKAKGLFAEFTPMLDFYEQMIGPYPFRDEKMGVVETPHLGMEHQTINAYGNKYRKDAYGFDWLLQHEFAHEWFGNQLTNKDWDDMWLHEGYGTYMQPLYMQWLRGDMEYYANLMKQRATLANRHPIVAGRPMREEDVYSDEKGPGHDIYYKASLVMHALRNLLGDKDFFAVTRQVVYGTTDPRPGNFKPLYADTHDYIAAVKKITGRDYQWFFDVYLYSAQLPELVATRDDKGLALHWKTPGDKPFPMPVEVRVGDRVVSLPMHGGQGHVDLPAGATYTLDPHSRLLRELPHIAAYQQSLDAEAKAKARSTAAGGK